MSKPDAPDDYPYVTHLNVLHPPLELIDVPALVDACDVPWYNQTLCEVNDSVLRVGIVEGEYHWHEHVEDDELFFVLEGTLFVDLEDRTFELSRGQGVVVPRGVRHRTRALEQTVMLMVETKEVVPTGDG